MSMRDADNQERLLAALDQLASQTALVQANWLVTTAALRSLEGLLAQIALGSESEQRTLSETSFPDAENDLYIWFREVQGTFHSNLPTHLLAFVRRLVASLSKETESLERKQMLKWICRSLYLMQGCMLLYEPSRSLFSRSSNMTFLVGFLDCDCPEEIHIDAIQSLVAVLVDRPDNLRTFEDVGGLRSISKLFLHAETAHRVKVKVLEFLYFYLIPEDVSMEKHERRLDSDVGDGTIRQIKGGPEESHRNTAASTLRVKQHNREPAQHDEQNESASKRDVRRTTEQKQIMLGQYFSNIDALVKDLVDFKPFGEF